MVTWCPRRLRCSAMVRSCDPAPPPPRSGKSLSSTIRTRRGAAPFVGAGAPWSGGIDMSPEPPFHDKESPDVVRMIPGAALVLSNQALHERRIPEAALPRPLVEQRLAHRGLE